MVEFKIDPFSQNLSKIITNDETIITIPDNVKSIIADDLFEFGKEVEELIIPSSVEVIQGISSSNTLKRIIFEPKSQLKRIGERGITRNKELKTIIFSGSHNLELGNGAMGINPVLSSVNLTVLDMVTIPFACFIGNSLKEIILPETVQSINEKAFMGNNLKSIVFNNSLSYLGNYCFARNEELEKVDLLKTNISSIENGAFKDCNIKEIIFNPFCFNIGEYAFANNSIKEIKLPQFIQKIGKRAFYQNFISNKPSMEDGIDKSAFEGQTVIS